MNEYTKNGTKKFVVYERPYTLFDTIVVASLGNVFFVKAFIP